MLVEPGTVIGGDFLIERFLKGGGMGEIYVARQISTQKLRALKLMKSELTRDPRSQERFKQEAQVAAKIDSANVVEVVIAGVDEKTGRPWLVMELLNGDDLSTYVKKHPPLSTSNIIRLYEQLCRALGKAHEAGIVHRDLKPENIFLVESREPDQPPFTVKVLDFGIAKIVADYNSQSAGTVQIGTPLWMAPEQTDSGAQITSAADIWPLGLMAFWLLTGHYYWRAAEKEPISVLAIMRELVSGPLENPSTRATELGCPERIPEGFDEWFRRCTDRDPKLRFPSAPVAASELTILLQAHRVSQRNPTGIPKVVQTESWKGDLQTHPPGPPPVKKQMPVLSLALAGALGVLALTGAVLGISKVGLERARGLCANAKADAAERAQACLRACDKGSLPECLSGGEMVLALQPISRNAGSEAGRAFKSACEGKQPGGCSRMAKLLYNGEGGTWRDRPRALDLYLSSCESGEVKDCVTAGRILLAGDGTRSDPAQARELLKLACDRGDPEGCGALGGVELAGQGGHKDPNKAWMHFQQGCDKGDSASCVAVGDQMRADDGVVKKNDPGALTAYKKACEMGSTAGCVHEADMESAGLGTAKDEFRAAKHYRDACDKKDARGCVGLARYELDGSGGVPKNPSHAIEQLSQYCEQEHLAAACFELGNAYSRGRGLEPDPAKAQQYLDAACKGGVNAACRKPIPSPPLTPAPCPNVERLSDRCDGGDGNICVQLGQMYEKGGKCARQNLCEGHRLYKIGCNSYQHQKSCDHHARFHSQYGEKCGG